MEFVLNAKQEHTQQEEKILVNHVQREHILEQDNLLVLLVQMEDMQMKLGYQLVKHVQQRVMEIV